MLTAAWVVTAFCGLSTAVAAYFAKRFFDRLEKSIDRLSDKIERLAEVSASYEPRLSALENREKSL